MKTAQTGAHRPADKPSLIVGVGASAGGLKALEGLLTPLTQQFNFAIVFVQHLSAQHKNLLPELIRSLRPDLEIIEITDGLAVLPGRIYLCPPGREVQVQRGIFQIAIPAEGRVRLPIDEFFTSLAAEAGERAIAVILSGEGTDGARGIRAIRSAGGAVFAQDPATAEFAGMPLATISTGQADVVLPPEDIARELLKIQESGSPAKSPESLITPAQFETFYRLIQEKTGSRFNQYKKSVVARRIRRRMYLLGVPTLQEYAQLIANNDAEAALLASDLMIGVTAFFRDRVAWRALRIDVVNKLVAEDERAPLRIWTPACATGEEAYSIAMLLHHELAIAGKNREINVFATDVNDQALERAREGRYPGSIVADVPPEFMRKYFTCSGDGLSVIINKEIRECVVFAKQDLLTDPPFSRLDTIICRNLLIYLDPHGQEKCVSLFQYALKEGGYLFLGNAESLGGRHTAFKTIGHKKCRIYRKIASPSEGRLTMTVPFAAERAAALSARQAATAEGRQSLTGVIQETLLEEYAPAAVAIDQNYDISYHNGPTHRYLRQPRGIPTQNLLELVPEGLRSRIRGALYQAIQEEKTIALRTSLTGPDERKRQVTLRIAKVRENLFLIVFREKGSAAEAAGAVSLEAEAGEETAVHQLEGELAATRQDLQSHIEQLKSLNEELQSSNEELQAANEELETSREELQSLNEELVTVNAQIQSKIEEQEETNNDLNNFLASTNIPTIFLDHNFRVKRFTPAMAKLIKLIPSDVGRPIIDMSRERLGPDLVADAQAVLDHLTPLRKEITIDGACHVRTVLPYRTADNRIEGVVITYSDVSELKEAEEATRHLASFPQLNPNPVLEVDVSGKCTFFNPATQKLLEDLGLDRGDPAPFLPPDLDTILGDWDKNRDTTVQREVMIKDRVFTETVHLNPAFQAARIYAQDITLRKRAEERVRESEQRLNRAQAIAHLGSWELDLQNNRLSWSDEVYRIFGLQPQEFAATYEAFLAAVHPDDRAAVDAAYTGSLSEGRDSYMLEHRVVRKNTGEIRYVQEKCEHLRDETGKIFRSAGMVHDITERKEVEELTKSLTVIGEIIHSTLDFRTIMRLALVEAAKALGCDSAALSLRREDRWVVSYSFGLAENIVGRVMDDAQEPHALLALTTQKPVAINDTSRDARVNRQHMMKYGIRAVLVCPLLSANEAIGVIFFNYHTTAVQFTAGQIEFAQRLGTSLSLALQNARLFEERLQREAQQEEYLHRLEKLLAISTEVLSSKTEEEMLRKVTDAAREMVGAKLAVAGHGYREGTFRVGGASRNAEAVPCPEGEVFAMERGGTYLELIEGATSLRLSDAELRSHPRWQGLPEGHTPLRGLLGAPLLGDSGAVAGLIMVSDKEQGEFSAEDEILLRQLAALTSLGLQHIEARQVAEVRAGEFAAANKDLESFIYSVSHDLRGPLRSMAIFTKIIAESCYASLDAKGKNYFHRVQEAGIRMNRLIEDLLHLSRVSRQPLTRTTVDMSTMATHILQELRESAPERAVEMEIAAGLTASADPQLMELALRNLLGNAWKFTSKSAQARIGLGTLKQEGKTVFYVQDNGAGFDPDYTEKMFQPFQRLHSEAEFEGTGIGLAIVEQAVRRHSGKVWAKGEVGKGATIFFTLA